MMSPNFREVGISAIAGVFTSGGTLFNSVISTGLTSTPVVDPSWKIAAPIL